VSAIYHASMQSSVRLLRTAAKTVRQENNSMRESAMTAKIEVRNLYKVFGPHPDKALSLLHEGIDRETIMKETAQNVAVSDVSFAVENGEIFVIMGLSGSGKSTILRCLNHLIAATSGSISLEGKDITHLNPGDLRRIRQKRMAMVFQQFALLPHRTVLQNVAFGLEVQGVAKTEREERAAQHLSMVGLAGREEAYPDDLSGGMKQRVGLARALASGTDILLMDEAFSALDPLIREELQDDLLQLLHQMEKTIVFITHDMHEALKLGTHIAFLKDGNIVRSGTPQEIINNPNDEYVARFLKGIGG
jgi:glycine betaine/proline transport system ATP-binding protein